MKIYINYYIISSIHFREQIRKISCTTYLHVHYIRDSHWCIVGPSVGISIIRHNNNIYIYITRELNFPCPSDNCRRDQFNGLRQGRETRHIFGPRLRLPRKTLPHILRNLFRPWDQQLQRWYRPIAARLSGCILPRTKYLPKLRKETGQFNIIQHRKH